MLNGSDAIILTRAEARQLLRLLNLERITREAMDNLRKIDADATTTALRLHDLILAYDRKDE